MSYKDLFKTSASSDSDKPGDKVADKPGTPESPTPTKEDKKSKS